jgi:signal transduction histidine kinase
VTWRLVAVLVGLTATVLVVHDLPLARHLERVERDRLVTAMERDGFLLAGRAEDVLGAGIAGRDAALRAVVRDYDDHTGAAVVISDVDGFVVASSHTGADAPVGTQVGAQVGQDPDVAGALRGEVVVTEPDGPARVRVTVPVLSGPDVLGAVRLDHARAVVDDRVAARVQGLAAVALISLAAAAVAAWLVAVRMTRPLRRLRALTDRVAAGRLSARANVDEGPPEIRGLAASFNTMSDQVERLLQRQRAFAGDASHQLRTPLTALRLRLEQAAEALERDPELARVRLEGAAAETERLQRLVEGLLALARAEREDQELVATDVADVARQRVDLWQPLAEERDVRLELDASGRAVALAVPDAVSQILDNYVDNALDVAPPGTAITVTIELTETTVVVHVEDEGRGMDDDDLARSFTRFWQHSPGRNGSGLGLAIVHQLAAASGATVELRRRPDTGIDAVATFRRTAHDLVGEPPGVLAR